jgi:DNA (cytosine-5)-methyltransferase 1
MTAYYNEFNPEAAAHLRNLIKRGLIAPGDVDERSIIDVRADDLIGYRQCHFFAGIGGWPLALRFAKVRDDAPVWTGSPPCQPYSCAGKKLGFSDPRHLAPKLLDLIAERKPSMFFGEQVTPAIGKNWLDFVHLEMEAEGYACGTAVLPACCIGAPHERKRAFIGAVRGLVYANNQCELSASNASGNGDIDGTGSASNESWNRSEWIPCKDGRSRPIEPGLSPVVNGIPKGMGRGKHSLAAMAAANRRSRIRGYGNAIVPQLAAQFIMAFMEATYAPAI